MDSEEKFPSPMLTSVKQGRARTANQKAVNSIASSCPQSQVLRAEVPQASLEVSQHQSRVFQSDGACSWGTVLQCQSLPPPFLTQLFDDMKLELVIENLGVRDSIDSIHMAIPDEPYVKEVFGNFEVGLPSVARSSNGEGKLGSCHGRPPCQVHLHQHSKDLNLFGHHLPS